MVKRSLLIFIITIFFISSVSCNKAKNNNSNFKSEGGEAIFTLWIYPIGTLSETYQISLFENNIMRVEMGDRDENNFSDPTTLKKIDEKDDVKLSDENYNKIIQMIDNIYQNDDMKTDTTTVLDVWMIKFSYKDKNIIQPCYEYTSHELEDFYNFLIGLSPIKIDMRGFA